MLDENPRYDSYKDSGVPWIGAVPSDWDVLPGRACLYESSEKNTGMKEDTVLSLSFGRVKVKPVAEQFGLVPESYETYQIVQPGDIIIRGTDLQNDVTSLRTGLAKDHGIITSAYINLRPRSNISPFYLHYLLSNYDDMKVFYGLGSGLRQNLSYDDFKYMGIIVPDLETQARIVSFLDEKTAEIDAAVEKKRRLIDLLNEQKSILINRAVTNGLNPDATMKDSGVDWIGEIPAHWDVKRAKYVFDEIDQRSATGEEELLSVSHTTGVTPRSEKNIMMFMAEDYTGSKLCQPSDVVFNIMWAWMGALGVSEHDGIVSPSYGVFRSKEPYAFNNWYLENLLRSWGYVQEYNRRSTGLHSSRLRLYAHMFFAMEIGFPSRAEQNEIERETKDRLELFDQSIDATEREITTLNEFKQTLIANAVTGKIKI